MNTRRITLLAVAMVAAFALATGPASATTWTPAGTAFTGTSSGFHFTLAGNDLNCTSSQISGTTPNPVSSNLTLSAPTGVSFSNCIPTGAPGRTVTTSGNWTLQSGGPFGVGSHIVTIKVPAGGLRVNMNYGFGLNCTLTLAVAQFDAVYNSISDQLSVNSVLPFTASAFPCTNVNQTLYGLFTVTPSSIGIV